MDQKAVSSVIGSSIMTDTQVALGDITDVFVDLTEQRVVKFEVDWLAERRAVSGSEENLPFTQVLRFDPHFLIVSGEIADTAGLDFIPVSEGGNLLVNQEILGRPLLDQEGNPLGTFSDLYFDPTDGAIIGYEITPITEEGRSLLLPPTTGMELFPEGIRIPDQAKQAMMEGHLRITTWEGEVEEAEYEVFGEDLPDLRTQRPEPFDLEGSQEGVPVRQYDEEKSFADEEGFTVYEGLPEPVGGPHSFAAEHPAVPLDEREDEDLLQD